MVQYFEFFLPADNPSALTGQVGGLISSDLLSNTVGELFARRDTSETGTINQFRKMFIYQTGDGTFSNLQVHMLNTEHTGQLSMTSELISGDTSEGPTIFPSGYSGDSFSGHSDQYLDLGSSSPGDSFGIWVKQSLDDNITNDNLASFILQIKGDVV